jgi:acyl-coenzyme A synthetase/AMP-(fatty) acid ligase/acyl carrier protein
MTEGKRVLQFSPFSFDASVRETVMALRNGAALVLTRQEVLASGPDFLKLMQEQRITTVTLPPSLLSVLSPGELPDLTTVIAAGERCTNEIVQAWAPGRSFFDAYGPTETTVCASLYRCNPAISWPFGGPPIGKPISNFQLYVVDENLQPQPAGVPGELLIGGVGLAAGYLNRPELTAERFIRNPLGLDKPGFADTRVYRSGDLVRWLPSGELEFLGRIDDQVKVRGFRIELGEIESVMREHPGVKDAVVAARADTLVGYLLPAGDAADAPAAGELRAHLRSRLPEYMVPAAFVVMDAFPRSPAGKIDRKSLPAPDQTRRDAATEYVAPRTETEQKLAAAVGELLKLERVGVNDNFFELGGHSLLATQLISRIREQFRVAIPLKVLFEHPTVAGLAIAVDQGLKQQAAEAAKVADALAMVKGMTPEQVKAVLAAKKARAAGDRPVQGEKASRQ